MKKQIIAILCSALTLAATMAACAPQAPGTDDPASTPASRQAAQVPNPITEYATIEEAQAAAGFDVKLPAAIPDGYAVSRIAVIAGTPVDAGDPPADADVLSGAGPIGGAGDVKSEPLVEITWANGDSTITYRVAKGDGADLSGDYTEYAERETAAVGAWTVQTRGDAGKVRVACWSADGFDHAISVDDGGKGMDVAAIETIIGSLQ